MFSGSIGEHWATGAARSGDIEILEWATSGAESKVLSIPYIRTPCSLTLRTSIQAAKSGNLKVLQWLQSKGAPLHLSVLYAAAKSGSRELVEWIMEHGYISDSRACMRAAEAGHFELAKFLYVEPAKMPLAKEAAVKGNIEILEWLYEEGPFLDIQAIGIKAIQSGQLDVLKWLRAKGWTLFGYETKEAADSGRIDVMQWVLENGGKLEEQTMTIAALKGHFGLVQWLRANGCPWDETTTTETAYHGKFEMFKWLFENSCPVLIQRSAKPTRRKFITAGGLLLNSQLEVLKFLSNHGILLEESCYNLAITQNLKIEAFDLLYELGCPWSAALWKLALGKNALNILEWLKTKNCPYVTVVEGDEWTEKTREWMERNGYSVHASSARTREVKLKKNLQ